MKREAHEKDLERDQHTTAHKVTERRILMYFFKVMPEQKDRGRELSEARENWQISTNGGKSYTLFDVCMQVCMEKMQKIQKKKLHF